MSEYDQAARVRLERVSHFLSASGARKRNPAAQRETKAASGHLSEGLCFSGLGVAAGCRRAFPAAEIFMQKSDSSGARSSCTELLKQLRLEEALLFFGSRETITGFDSRTVNQLLPPVLSARLF